MTTVRICRCGHTERAHERGYCYGLVRIIRNDGEADRGPCNCHEYAEADGEQAVLL